MDRGATRHKTAVMIAAEPLDLLVSHHFAAVSSGMPAYRRLSDHQLIAARLEYETTAISERTLSAKYGLTRNAIREWILRQGWTRAAVPRRYEGAAGQARFQCDVLTAIKAAEVRKTVQSLEQSLLLPVAGPRSGKLAKLATPRQAGQVATAGGAGSERCPGDRPKQPGFGSEPGVRTKRRTAAPTAEVVRFPGPYAAPPPQTKLATPLPDPVTEPMAAPMPHAAQGNALALQQLALLEPHLQLLREHQHLFGVYLAPDRHVDTTGLHPAQAAEKLAAISRAAGQRIMPGKNDTVAGTLLALTKAIISTLAAQREAADWATRAETGRGPSPAAHTPPRMRDLNTLSLSELRQVQQAMALLTGAPQCDREPPKPPPPEELDDLMAGRDAIRSE